MNFDFGDWVQSSPGLDCAAGTSAITERAVLMALARGHRISRAEFDAYMNRLRSPQGGAI